MRAGFRYRWRARVAGVRGSGRSGGGEGRRGGGGGTEAGARQVSRSAFHREREAEAAPASPPPPAASGERLRPGPPVTRGGGLSAAPGLGPCRPLSA